MGKQNKVGVFSLLSISKILILISILIVPLLFWPNGIHFFENLKTGLYFGALVLVLLLWSISRLKNESFKFPKNLFSLSIILILLVSLLSSIFSENPFVSILGVQLSTASFAGLLILFVSSLTIASLFENKKSAYVITFVTYLSLVLSLIVNLAYVLIDTLPNFGFFVSNSINTIGKWSDLGVVSALTIVLSYLIIETLQKRNLLKILAWVGLIVSIITALIVSETIIWILLGLISIIYLVYKIVSSRSSSESFNQNLPYTTITVILISFIMILAGGLISNFTDQFLRINFTETKPGIQSTFEMTQKTISENPILGVGVNRFERAWQLYKPDGINVTDFWGTDFVYGYSYLMSIPAQNGILGLLAWLFFIVVLVWNSIKLLFKNSESAIENKMSLIHGFSVILLLLVLLIHVPSVTVLILFFVFLGMFIGTLSRNGLYKTNEINLNDKPKTGFLFVFAIVVLMIMSIYLGYMFARQFVSTITLERANYNLALGDFQGAQNNLVFSINTLTTDLGLRSLSEYYQIEINRLLQNQSLENQSTIDSFRGLLTNSINAANTAIAFDRNNHQNHLALAGIYEQLTTLNVEGSYEESIRSYENALAVNPNNPGIYLGMARAAFAGQDNDAAREYIDKALEMNPRFVDAAFLLSQIQVAEGNIDEAIRSVEASINIQPNNPNLYFQLGLLRYNQENFNGSIAAFERAVILNPVFANAKYFLGLSYEKVGRIEEAISQFKDLEYLNPENQEIKNIISNLESGQSSTDTQEEEIESTEELEELPLEESDSTDQ